MSELIFKIITSGLVGCLIIIALGFSIGIFARATDWMDRMLGLLLIFFSMFLVLVFVLIWTTDIVGLE